MQGDMREMLKRYQFRSTVGVLGLFIPVEGRPSNPDLALRVLGGQTFIDAVEKFAKLMRFEFASHQEGNMRIFDFTSFLLHIARLSQGLDDASVDLIATVICKRKDYFYKKIIDQTFNETVFSTLKEQYLERYELILCTMVHYADQETWQMINWLREHQVMSQFCLNDLLSTALRMHAAKVAEVLIERFGAKVDTDLLEIPLFDAYCPENAAELLTLLLKRGAKVTVEVLQKIPKNEVGKDFQVLKKLLNFMLHADWNPSFTKPVLEICLHHKSAELFSAFQKNAPWFFTTQFQGPNPQVSYHPLHLLAQYHNWVSEYSDDCYLLDVRTCSNVPEFDGDTILHFLCRHFHRGHLQAIMPFISEKHLAAKNAVGKTPIHYLFDNVDQWIGDNFYNTAAYQMLQKGATLDLSDMRVINSLLVEGGNIPDNTRALILKNSRGLSDFLRQKLLKLLSEYSPGGEVQSLSQICSYCVGLLRTWQTNYQANSGHVKEFVETLEKDAALKELLHWRYHCADGFHRYFIEKNNGLADQYQWKIDYYLYSFEQWACNDPNWAWPVEMMPLELWKNIMDYLPRNSVLSLGKTCKILNNDLINTFIATQSMIDELTQFFPSNFPHASVLLRNDLSNSGKIQALIEGFVRKEDAKKIILNYPSPVKLSMNNLFMAICLPNRAWVYQEQLQKNPNKKIAISNSVKLQPYVQALISVVNMHGLHRLYDHLQFSLPPLAHVSVIRCAIDKTDIALVRKVLGTSAIIPPQEVIQCILVSKNREICHLLLDKLVSPGSYVIQLRYHRWVSDEKYFSMLQDCVRSLTSGLKKMIHTILDNYIGNHKVYSVLDRFWISRPNEKQRRIYRAEKAPKNFYNFEMGDQLHHEIFAMMAEYLQREDIKANKNNHRLHHIVKYLHNEKSGKKMLPLLSLLSFRDVRSHDVVFNQYSVPIEYQMPPSSANPDDPSYREFYRVYLIEVFKKWHELVCKTSNEHVNHNRTTRI